MTRISINRQQGLSLVELMIASLLGLLLMGGVIQLFISSNTTYRVQEGLSRVQEAGRYAVDRMAYDIRMAGYVGCGNLDRIPLNVIANSPPNFGPGTALVGYDGGAGWMNPTTILHEPGTDVVEVRRASDVDMQLTGNMATVNANIQIDDNTLNVQAGDALFITDCVQADLFRATSVSSGGGTVTIAHSESQNTANFLSKPYNTEASVMAFRETTYFVGRSTAGAEPSLYLYDGTQALELVSGIEDMELEFGVDPDRDFSINGYANAGAVADWNDVRSVRVALLISSTEEVKQADESIQYSLFGNSVTIDDRRLRQVFSADIAIRNRLF
jgi:type IV pilus assembly protein PilW